jgi:signal transduction histidine kinase
MLLPTSSEFLALCQSQLGLLAQNLGADLSIIYLAEEMSTIGEARSGPTETKLIPIASLPENRALPWGNEGSPSIPTNLAQPDRLVLPLIHEEMVLGLLVTERIDRRWGLVEQQQIEQIGKTIALACVLDQRSQWLTQRQQNQAQLQLKQQDLMDNLVHQFRNPLTALRTFGKLLMRRLPETDSNREVAASIVRESDRLQEMLLQIDRAIDSPQIEAEVPNIPRQMAGTLAGTLGEGELTIEGCDVRSILQPLLVSAMAVAQEKNLALHTEFPEVLPMIWANASGLREVLSNLIDNAVKYTPENGEVHVKIAAENQTVTVRVTDNGGGIPDQDLPQLFQRHFRGVQSATTTPGTGLGLSIARELIQQMQGDIQVFSPMQPQGWITEEGKLPDRRGVTFLVTLTIVN